MIYMRNMVGGRLSSRETRLARTSSLEVSLILPVMGDVDEMPPSSHQAIQM
jgi:hypothetical protein